MYFGLKRSNLLKCYIAAPRCTVVFRADKDQRRRTGLVKLAQAPSPGAAVLPAHETLRWRGPRHRTPRDPSVAFSETGRWRGST